MKWLFAFLAIALAVPAAAQESEMLIIAHRGASGERPEHTLAAYERAIDQGADYIEPDLVPTKDGVLVARHENEISGTTDVAELPEFAARAATRTIDGADVTGWFTEDFTLAELRTLRAQERLPALRPANAAFDGLYQVPTLAEIIGLVRAKEAETGRRIGLYPEIKHPGYFADIGHDLAAMLVEQLHAAGYRSAADPVFIQSFEVTPLRRLDTMTDLRLVQLVSAEGGPADLPDMTYAVMLTPQGLANIASYADGIGAEIGLVTNQPYGEPSGLVRAAHENSLVVHAWTARRERAFAPSWARGTGIEDSQANGGCTDLIWEALQRADVDGVFTDQPGWAIEVLGGRSETLCF